jgi:pimeloyl-ACP methyl ester carboxylesterase
MKRIFFSIAMLVAVSAYCQQQAFKVEVYGKGQPIILIPGYACSGDVWKETVESFKKNYQLHVITFAGFAGVPPVDTPVLKTVKNEIIKYVKENHLNKPVLIGHSLGAFMSLWVASEEPSLFSKILCVDGVPFISSMLSPSTTAEEIKNDPSYNAEVIAKNFINMPAKEFREKQFKSMPNMVSDSTHATLITRWSEESDRRTLGYTYVEMSTTDLRNEISKINIPVLVLGSTYGTKEISQKMLGDEYSQLKNKLVVIAPTKHFIMYDDPIWFREELKNFLRNGLAN